MTEDPASLGRWAEDLAWKRLRSQGLAGLTRNYRVRGGEIDLVLRDGDTLVFVEVRWRRRNDFGSGAETIDGRKQSRIIRAAEHFLQQRRATATPCRFDVVSVSGDREAPGVEWIRDAFRA